MGGIVRRALLLQNTKTKVSYDSRVKLKMFAEKHFMAKRSNW